jgi:hypothetical protein
VQLIGNHTNFVSSRENGLTSTPFPSIFPLSFRLSASTELKSCTDLRTEALVYNVLATAILFLLLRPPPRILFWSLFFAGFWHVAMFSQPRRYPPPMADYIGTFLPALFVAAALWRWAWSRTLPAFRSLVIERTIWYLAPFWAGVEYNVITSNIPVSRLLASDIANRKGALASVLVVSIVALVFIVLQLRMLWKENAVLRLMAWYLAGGICILISALLLDLQFRLHHYFVAILITSIATPRTRLSAAAQAFALGMFLNGIAAFDFDSILQTSGEASVVSCQCPALLLNWDHSYYEMVRWGRKDRFSPPIHQTGTLHFH